MAAAGVPARRLERSSANRSGGCCRLPPVTGMPSCRAGAAPMAFSRHWCRGARPLGFVRVSSRWSRHIGRIAGWRCSGSLGGGTECSCCAVFRRSGSWALSRGGANGLGVGASSGLGADAAMESRPGWVGPALARLSSPAVAKVVIRLPAGVGPRTSGEPGPVFLLLPGPCGTASS